MLISSTGGTILFLYRIMILSEILKMFLCHLGCMRPRAKSVLLFFLAHLSTCAHGELLLLVSVIYVKPLCVVRRLLACEHSRGHSFSPIIIKNAQNDHLDNISIKFQYGSCGVKNKVSRSTHGKNFWTLKRPQFWSNHHQTCSECSSWQYLCLIRIWVMSGQKQGQ